MTTRDHGGTTTVRPPGTGDRGTARPAPDFHQEWIAALDEMEVDVARAETLTSDARAAATMSASGQWTAPVGLGPLPGDLRGRAEEIFRRQVAAGTAIGHLMAGNRRHTSLLTRIDDGSDGGRPAFVDWAI